MYKIIKPLLFTQDPEDVHNRMIRLGNLLGRFSFFRNLLSSMFVYKNKKLETKVMGIKFRNPVGLAAGFDKNADLPDILPSIGFGFAELGSITGEQCDGNPRPRLWRVPEKKSIIVNYGLCNEGAEAISKKLRGRKFQIPIGLSVARTNREGFEGERGRKDYAKAFRLMQPHTKYITVNVSCPNIPGGNPVTSPNEINKLLKELKKQKITKPVLLKLKPSYTKAQLNQIIKIVKKYKFIKGFVLTNLFKKKGQKGGASGGAVKKQSTEAIKYLYKKTKGEYVIIGLGGIFSAEDAYEKIKAGASLVQIITGMIYNGPGVVKEINKGLVSLMEKDGYKNISQVVGTTVK